MGNTPYSQGYHLPGTKYRTILAYYHGDHRLRANHYSNPSDNFQDVPTGDADTADAARRMTEIRFVIGAIGDESETCTTLPAPTTTLAPTTSPTTTVNCTDDGSNIVYEAFIIQNDRDSKVMADNGFGKTVLAERLVGDLGQGDQRWNRPPHGLWAKGHLDLRTNGRVDVQFREQGNPGGGRPIRAIHQEGEAEDHEEDALPQGN